ncbi:MAG: transposase family protein, partial [Pseudobacteriovorax sp.]|nr:transposase family protein [Pseudobacteriovorax sp.]
LSLTRGLPDQIGVDQGPEFTSEIIQTWFRENDVSPWFCSPGNKNENAFIESFNGRLRDECLNMEWFKGLKEARYLIEQWRYKYNYERPHTSIGGLTPKELAMRLASG